MFSKAKKSNGDVAAPKADARKQVPSIISASLRIVGNLVSAGDVQVDGIVDGDVKSRTLTISQGAAVNGSIEADSVYIQGQVNGQITAENVVLGASARRRRRRAQQSDHRIRRVPRRSLPASRRGHCGRGSTRRDSRWRLAVRCRGARRGQPGGRGRIAPAARSDRRVKQRAPSCFAGRDSFRWIELRWSSFRGLSLAGLNIASLRATPPPGAV